MDSINAEFDRQKSNLIRLSLDGIGTATPEFLGDQIERLREGLHKLPDLSDDRERIRVPFVIVVKSDLLPVEALMPLVKSKGHVGCVNMYPVEPSSFLPIPQVQVPGQPVYLLFDIDTGRNCLNVTPADATGHRPHPLTVLRSKDLAACAEATGKPFRMERLMCYAG